MAPIIHTEKLRKVYAVGKERVVALNNVDLSIEKGEFCCIVGQSGSGKSTLLNQLAGLEKPTSGKVFIGRHEISKMTENELAEFRQQQRVGIARAFVSSPKVIFADEPTGNLDSRTSKQVLYRMLELSKNNSVTFVMVTHEPELAECADRIVTILDGKVCSNVVQDEEAKQRNRDALFADLKGDLNIGGEAAKEHTTEKPAPAEKA